MFERWITDPRSIFKYNWRGKFLWWGILNFTSKEQIGISSGAFPVICCDISWAVVARRYTEVTKPYSNCFGYTILLVMQKWHNCVGAIPLLYQTTSVMLFLTHTDEMTFVKVTAIKNIWQGICLFFEKQVHSTQCKLRNCWGRKLLSCVAFWLAQYSTQANVNTCPPPIPIRPSGLHNRSMCYMMYCTIQGQTGMSISFVCNPVYLIMVAYRNAALGTLKRIGTELWNEFTRSR